FCSPERLESLRKMQEASHQPTKYDWHCRHLTEAEIKEKKEAGEKYVIRMKVPENQELEFTDWIRGKIKIETKEIDDQIILKSDGFPTYHLASVVDDHLMQISHVIRGEEWLPSTPKHILLYLFFGWETPQFIHLPLILNPDKTKLSKRQGDVAVEDYLKQGYLPEALINYIVLLGWNPGTEQEIFSLAELIRSFDLTKVHKAGAVFSREKLDWMNREYLKKMPSAEFQKTALPYLKENYPGVEFNPKIFALEQQRISRLDEMGEGIQFIFQEIPYDPSLLIWKNVEKEKIKENLILISTELEKYSGQWEAKDLENHLIAFIKEKGLSNGEMLWPMRTALSGLDKSPSPFELADVLGKEKTLARLRKGIDLL
ncbi:MAG: glutamate--tRNA ligase, partial [Patescibacteria group bacterium]